MVLRQLVTHMQKNEVRTSHPIHKNEPQTDQRPNVIDKTLQFLEKSVSLCDLRLDNDF